MFEFDYDKSDIVEDVREFDPRSNVNEYDLMPLNFAMDELDQFALYSITMSCEPISHSALTNMKTMFAIMDDKPYRTNDAAKARIEFIRLALEARTDANLTSKTLVKQYILRNCDNRLKDIIEQDIIKPLTGQKMTVDEAKFINTLVYDNLVSGWSITYSKQLSNLLEKKDMGYYNRISDFSKDLKQIIKNINSEIDRSEEYMRDGKGFDLTEDNIYGKVESLMAGYKAPTNKIRTGLQFLNKMLNGGFESGRSYLFLAASGVGKSLILLSCALWAKQYNKLPCDEDERLAVLFISQENSESESFERFFNMSVSGDDIRNYTTEQVVEALRNSGFLIDKKQKKSDKIDFIFKYYSNQEIGVSDIDALISDYKRKGIRIIMCVQDYIERLKPKINYNELRYTLGSLGTEISELAKKWQIPILSAAQLNRAAATTINDGIMNNKTNLIKYLGANNVSEAWSLIMNVDVVIIINRETDDTQEGLPEYMGFKLAKLRGKPNKDKIYMFLHPFDSVNGIVLTPDIEGKPLSRATIEEFNPLYQKKPQYVPTKEDIDNEKSSDSFLDYCSSLSKAFDDDDEYGNSYAAGHDLAERSIQNKLNEMREREIQIKRQHEIDKNKPIVGLETIDGCVRIHSRKDKIVLIVDDK